LYTDGVGASIFVDFSNVASSPLSEVNFTVANTTQNIRFNVALEPARASFYGDTLLDTGFVAGNSYPILVSALFADGSTYATVLTVPCQFVSYLPPSEILLVTPSGTLYAGGNILLSLSPDDFSPETSSTNYSGVNVLMQDEGYLYLGLNTGDVVKVDMQSFSQVASVHFAHNPNRPVDAVLQDGFIYTVGYLPPKLFKINITNMTEAAEVTLTTWNSKYKKPSIVEADQSAVYVACAISTGLIIKTNLNLSYVSKWETTYGQVVNLISDGGFVYALVKSSAKNLFKINATTMQTVASATLTDLNYTSLIGLATDDQYLYATAATPLAVTKIAKADLNTTLQKTYPSEYYATMSPTCTRISGGSLYIAAVKSGTPNMGGILRINTEDLEIAFERFDPSYQLYTILP
jgi:hypothetical protein